MAYKLGSLFDGSGGFPLSGALCGIEPTWAAEVEPYPIAVTRSRFPNMRHLGDISKVSGADIEPVDVITFGSPCQDLSVAGKRAGLKHEANGDEETTRSGLFMEAVRIIKEMREATNGEYPRFALWENVPGAFSSNKGEDFRIVCEELIKIIEPRASMPAVPAKGWPYSDSYCGDGWSLAYRVFDAQYWGVPQRRRRIHLVLDLRDQCAREVLFEREGLRGYFAEGRTPWQSPAAHAQDCSGADDRAGESAGGLLTPSDPGYSDGLLGGRQLDAVTLEPGIASREGGHIYEGVSGTLRAEPGDNRMAVAFGVDLYNTLETGDKAATLTTQGGGTASGPSVCVPYTLKVRSGCDVDSSGKAAGKGALIQVDKAATLATVQDQYLFQPMAYSFDSLASNSMKSSNPHSGCRAVEVAKTLDTSDPNPSKNQGGIAIVAPVAVNQHAQSDSWTLEKGEAVQTLPAAMGMGGGHGPLIIDTIGGQAERAWEGEIAPTLKATHYKMAPCVAVPAAVYESHPMDSRVTECDEVGPTVTTKYAKGTADTPLVCFPVENHPADSRVNIDESGKVQTLTSRMGTGGGNVPMVMEGRPAVQLASGNPVTGCLMASGYEKLGAQEMFSGDYTVIEEKPVVFDGANVTSPVNASNPMPGDPCHTLSTDSRNYLVEPVYCLQGNGIDRADTAGCNGKGVKEDISYTLNTIDRPAVAYGIDPGASRDVGKLFIEEQSKTLTNGTCPGHHNGVAIAYCTDVGFFGSAEEKAPTLLARQYKDPHLVSYPEGEIHYIVRRLTPTECARLQGFADRWGHIDQKEVLSTEEYHFWLDVRNTHAAINGKAVKDYSPAQMLTWYNKLHTDAAEYKMWGNGIALPPALYCMQGIVDVLNKEDDDSWLM